MSIDTEQIKKLWYIDTMEYYSAITRSILKSVLMRQMNLEPIIQSEVSKKEKNKYGIVMCIYGIQKDDIDEPICRVAVESTCQCRTCGFDPWVRKIPLRRKWQPTSVFCPGNPMDGGAWRLQFMGLQQSQTRFND